MARLARVVAVDIPHHVTQRGNRRMTTFFNDEDYLAYRSLMAQSCVEHGVEIWAYCLMPNHVHLIAVPFSEEALAKGIGRAHEQYTRRVNYREGWLGHLWQGRFASCPMDEKHLLAAARYIERNPVRAGLAERPEKWPWSSAAAHLRKRDDELVRVGPLLELAPNWRSFLKIEESAADLDLLRQHVCTGRPLGDQTFIEKIGKRLGRNLFPKKRGPKNKANN